MDDLDDEAVPLATLPLRELDSKTRDWRCLGQLLQSLPKFTFRLTEIEPENEELLHLARHHGFPAWPLLQHPGEYTRLTDETVLCGIVDAFKIYLADILLVSKPSDGAPPRGQLARQIDVILSNEGLEAIVAYITQLGFGESLTMSGGGYRQALEAIEVRNVVVFNRGIVDEGFRSHTGRSELRVGIRYPLETAQVLDWIDDLMGVAHFIDESFAARYELPVEPVIATDETPPS
jgi:hypothetical protein